MYVCVCVCVWCVCVCVVSNDGVPIAQVPSKLLIQVPRYGKQFKAFEKIIPNVRMSIDDLCASSANNTKSIKTTTQSNL